MKLSRAGDLLDVELLFALGGDDGQGGTWSYTSRALATVRLAPGLPAVRTAFWEGDRLRGDLRLEDGVWRGTRGNPDGTTRDVEIPANAQERRCSRPSVEVLVGASHGKIGSGAVDF